MTTTKTHWNYRVFQWTNDDGEVWFDIREVYYADGKPQLYSSQAQAAYGETPEALWRQLLLMGQAGVGKPVLKASDFPAGGEAYGAFSRETEHDE